MSGAGIATMLVALLVEWRFGWPARLYNAIGHPVVWMGAWIDGCERRLNRAHHAPSLRYAFGALVTVVTVGAAALVGWTVQAGIWALVAAVPTAGDAPRVAFELGAVLTIGVMASSLMAARSLWQHVDAVRGPLSRGDLGQARVAVSHIVGRDVEALDESAVARASIETLAESTCDGVVAPLCWGVLFGLPGMAAYKATNTLDSMIGHRNARYHAFGGFAARLDDLANWVPARLTALLVVAVARGRRTAALAIALRDARRHRSPNAGWPEAATAGMLDVRLSGPRVYHGQSHAEPWIAGDAPDPDASALARALRRYRHAIEGVLIPLLGLSVAATWWLGGTFGGG